MISAAVSVAYIVQIIIKLYVAIFIASVEATNKATHNGTVTVYGIKSLKCKSFSREIVTYLEMQTYKPNLF